MEERKKPSTGQIYRHFKNKLYQIVTIAIKEDTREEMVVYQALYEDYGIYVRTLANFMEPVDTVKYKEITQKYRFELVDKKTLVDHQDVKEKSNEENNKKEEHEDGENAGVEPKIAEEELKADPKLLAFCEAETFLEKYEMLKSFRGEISDRLINDLAVVLDVVIPEGELDKRYEALLKCLQTFCKYEVNRLR